MISFNSNNILKKIEILNLYLLLKKKFHNSLDQNEY